MLGDEPGQALALPPRRSDPWIGIVKPCQGCVQKLVSGRSVRTGALSVEGPAEHEFRGTVTFSRHSSEPMVDKRRLADPSPGNDCNDIYLLVCPCIIQESDILLPTEHIASCNRQSGYGNFLRSHSYWRPASCGARIGRGYRPQALMSDCNPTIDSVHYRRHHLQQFG